MKHRDLTELTNEEFAKLSPRSEAEHEHFVAEKEYREWCADDDLDPTHEENRECYNEVRAEVDGFWDNLDENEKAGWESHMTND